MGGTTRIGWTDGTVNPTTPRCEHVTDECDHCYAETLANRWEGAGAFTSEPPRLKPGRLLLPWLDADMRRARRLFLESMSDPGHPGLPVDDLAKIWAMMAADQATDYQVLTKRPHVLVKRLTDPGFPDRVFEAISSLVDALTPPSGRLSKIRAASMQQIHAAISAYTWPLTNVWMGVSAGQQSSADRLIPVLNQIPAVLRFVSAEPLIEPTDFTAAWACTACASPNAQRTSHECGRCRGTGSLVDWLIVGGESGRRARPMHIAWLRDTIAQARRHQVPVWLKQWGEWGPAPWQVPVGGADQTWHGTADELAAARKHAQATAATHAYPQDAHLRGWQADKPAQPPWSGERAVLEAGQMPIRRWGSEAAGNELDGLRIEELPTSRRADLLTTLYGAPRGAALTATPV